MTKIAYISRNGKLSIWNIDNGIRVTIPEKIRKLNCLHLSQDFSSAYCYQNDSLVNAYELASAKKLMTINHPEGIYSNAFLNIIVNLFKLLKLKTPDFLYKIGMDKPQYAAIQAAADEAVYFYRIPNHRRNNNQQQYESVLLRNRLENGELIESYTYAEPYDIRLVKPSYSSKHHILIGEDSTIDKKNYKAFFAVNLKDDIKNRFGVECAQDWALIPDSNKIITCGFCDEKNQIRIWDIFPEKS